MTPDPRAYAETDTQAGARVELENAIKAKDWGAAHQVLARMGTEPAPDGSDLRLGLQVLEGGMGDFSNEDGAAPRLSFVTYCEKLRALPFLADVFRSGLSEPDHLVSLACGRRVKPLYSAPPAYQHNTLWEHVLALESSELARMALEFAPADPALSLPARLNLPEAPATPVTVHAQALHRAALRFGKGHVKAFRASAGLCRMLLSASAPILAVGSSNFAADALLSVAPTSSQSDALALLVRDYVAAGVIDIERKLSSFAKASQVATFSPLAAALRLGHRAVALALIDLGADVDIAAADLGRPGVSVLDVGEEMLRRFGLGSRVVRDQDVVMQFRADLTAAMMRRHVRPIASVAAPSQRRRSAL